MLTSPEPPLKVPEAREETESKIDLNTLKNADQIKEAFLQLSKEEVSDN